MYYVEEDWNLPIGYVYLNPATWWAGRGAHVSSCIWVRGEGYNFQPHSSIKAKRSAKCSTRAAKSARPGCESDIETEVTQQVEASTPQKAKWSRIKCDFPSVRAWDKTGEKPGMFGEIYQMDKNPGDYELKVLWNNHLARSLKFGSDPTVNT